MNGTRVLIGWKSIAHFCGMSSVQTMYNWNAQMPMPLTRPNGNVHITERMLLEYLRRRARINKIIVMLNERWPEQEIADAFEMDLDAIRPDIEKAREWSKELLDNDWKGAG